jgi:hypothetical protein
VTRDEELLAVALWVRRTQGARGPVYIAEQIGALALRGDQAGIDHWKKVAAQYQELQNGSAPLRSHWIKLEVALVGTFVALGLLQGARTLWQFMAAQL